MLHEGVNLEQLPHQLLIQGCTVLVLVPGRSPLCLRRHPGHIFRDCRVSRCNARGRFGHVAADCARTYATVSSVAEDVASPEAPMDQQEDEETAVGGGVEQTSTSYESSTLISVVVTAAQEPESQPHEASPVIESHLEVS